MCLGGDWPRVTNFGLKDNLIILFILILVTCGYSWKFELNSSFSDYYCFISEKSLSLSVLFTIFFVSIKEPRIRL